MFVAGIAELTGLAISVQLGLNGAFSSQAERVETLTSKYILLILERMGHGVYCTLLPTMAVLARTEFGLKKPMLTALRTKILPPCRRNARSKF